MNVVLFPSPWKMRSVHRRIAWLLNRFVCYVLCTWIFCYRWIMNNSHMCSTKVLVRINQTRTNDFSLKCAIFSTFDWNLYICFHIFHFHDIAITFLLKVFKETAALKRCSVLRKIVWKIKKKDSNNKRNCTHIVCDAVCECDVCGNSYIGMHAYVCVLVCFSPPYEARK